mgnify:CR=1 FL=1
MSRETVSVTMLILLLSILTFSIQPVNASPKIYIRADGRVEGTDKIVTEDNITYKFIDDIYNEIVIERDNIVLDGTGHALQGRAKENGVGINLSHRINVTIKNIKIKAFDIGIYLLNSFNNRISGNNIANSWCGIYIRNSSNNNILGNDIEDNRWSGIFLWHSFNNSITGNIFFNNGLVILDSYGNTILNNSVNDKPLVYLENVSSLEVTDAGQVILVNCKDITVEGLNISKATIGIELLKTKNARISGNNIEDNIAGIYLSYSSNNIISGNSIANNNWSGITLYNSSNNRISANNITNNKYGIYLQNSSVSNIIYHNNFINNTQQAYDAAWSMFRYLLSLFNIWDNGSSGNYWSNYVDVDKDNNGIWDHPYVIDKNNKDRYPLVKPWMRLFSDISCSVLPSTVGSGENIVIRGSISPAHPEVLVKLSWRPKGGSWKSLVTVKTDEKGEYSYNLSAPRELGSYEVRASWSGDEDHKAASSLYSFTVIKGTSNISLSVSSQVIRKGEIVALSGSISPPHSNVDVIIQISSDNGRSWSTLASLKTGPDGSYRYNWSTAQAGIFLIKSSWRGDKDHYGAESSILTVKIEEYDLKTLFIVFVVLVAFILALLLFLKRRKGKIPASS